MKYHFTGIAGFGMSALAQVAAMDGHEVSGSDRAFDMSTGEDIKDKFSALNVKIFPQNGDGINENLDLLIVSTAVEDDNKDIVKAKLLGIKIIHRSDFLLEWAKRFKTVAIGGTSGKSTVSAMVFHILERNGCSASIITGGALNSLIEKGMIGNAFLGKGEILVIEADESDGTIKKYSPYAGVVLNISKDHKDVFELKEIFKEFLSKCHNVFLNSDDENLKDFKADVSFGFNSGDIRAENISTGFKESFFKIKDVKFNIPLAGEHNVANALAAISVCVFLGIDLKECSSALESFKGVHRRFNILGEKNGVCVIDDFAHNPVKIRAALRAAMLGSFKRIIAIYQPHGFAPTKLLKEELIKVFSEVLRKEDILILPEIYYVGGTVNKTISSADLVSEIKKNGRNAFYFENRSDIIGEIKRIKKDGDRIIVMGARDITLSGFSRLIYDNL